MAGIQDKNIYPCIDEKKDGEDVDDVIKSRAIELENRFLTAVRSGNLRDLNNCIDLLANQENDLGSLANQKTDHENVANQKMDIENVANQDMDNKNLANQKTSDDTNKNILNQDQVECSTSKVYLMRVSNL